jgi:hypothetical protein
MNRILVCGLLMSFISYGLQAADSDLCSTNIKTLSEAENSAGVQGTDVKRLVSITIEDAKKAQASGDTEKCIDITSKALSKLRLLNR